MFAPSPPKGRITCVDLDDGLAASLLSDSLPMAAHCSNLVLYTELNFRRRGKWSELYKNRSFLADVFMATGGYLVRQSSLQRQMTAYVRKNNIQGEAMDIESLVYRIRAMMSHLRDAKAKAHKIPRRFECLASVLNNVRIEAPTQQQGVCESDNDYGECDVDDEVVEVPVKKARIDVVVCSSDSGESEVDVDELFGRLFGPWPGAARAAAAAPGLQEQQQLQEEPQKQQQQQLVLQQQQLQEEQQQLQEEPRQEEPEGKKEQNGIDYNKIDAMIASITTSVAPTSSEYKQLFKKKKKATTEKSSKNCGALRRPASAASAASDKAIVKRVYSKGYHTEAKVCRDRGMDPTAAKDLARNAGRQAVRLWHEANKK